MLKRFIQLVRLSKKFLDKMLFFCLWCNVETSCHKHLKSSPAIDKLRRLLKAISVTTFHRLAAPPLERSSTRGYASSDSRRFPKAAQNVSFLSIVHVVTDAPCTDTPPGGLAVFDYRPL